MPDGSKRDIGQLTPIAAIGGLFDLVEQIRAIRDASHKPLWAVVNASALSAAYAITSAADRLYVTRTGKVGSIGVVAVHVDEISADRKAGLAWTFVFAGERKIDANAHEPLSERARATIQADVDRLYAEFCAVVAANRTISSYAARDTNAAIYRGELAVRAGLADRVGTLDLAIAEMAADPRLKSGDDRAALTLRHHHSNPKKESVVGRRRAQWTRRMGCARNCRVFLCRVSEDGQLHRTGARFPVDSLRVLRSRCDEDRDCARACALQRHSTPSLRELLGHEGGYDNDPDDPGGPTNYGITIYDARRYWKANATAEDVRDMPVEAAKEI